MLLLLVQFVTVHFYFTILRGKLSCNLSITDAKPKQMKLTEHSCCFDNEDDGNFLETRDSVTPQRAGFIPGLFNDFSRTQRDNPPPLCSPGTSRKADLKKFAPEMWCLYFCLNDLPPLLHS